MLRRSRVAFSSFQHLPVAVLLSGCGVYDGSEIHEATCALIHLQRRQFTYRILAPSRQQFHVVNHQLGAPADGSTRFMHEEAARIARGPVLDATSLGASEGSALRFADDYSALLIPGGFGVMKNLSDFAVCGENKPKGPLPEVDALLAAFHARKKPIAAACIAPILLASRFKGCSITLGGLHGDAQQLAERLGASLVDRSTGGVAVDTTNRLVTAPAYMLDGAGPHDVFKDLGLLVDAMHELLQ